MNIAKRLFKQYVFPVAPDRFLNEGMVKITEGNDTAEEPFLIINYNWDGVEMRYFRRMTWHRDEFDNFVDEYVTVDGVIVRNARHI